jgi:hypothetical protein
MSETHNLCDFGEQCAECGDNGTVVFNGATTESACKRCSVFIAWMHQQDIAQGVREMQRINIKVRDLLEILDDGGGNMCEAWVLDTIRKILVLFGIKHTQEQLEGVVREYFGA